MAAKRSTTLKKTPRRTTSASNKENTPGSNDQENPKVSTPGDVSTRRSFASSTKKRPALPSPILPSSSPPVPLATTQNADPDAAMWSRKVRRSYSRLSDQSINSPDTRENLFGFEKLQTPEVFRKPKTPLQQETSGGLNLFMNFLHELDSEHGPGTAAGPGTQPEPDTNIPGVAVVKKRRRKKVQQIGETELDEMAAKMNAEFEEAEEFELVVE